MNENAICGFTTYDRHLQIHQTVFATTLPAPCLVSFPASLHFSPKWMAQANSAIKVRPTITDPWLFKNKQLSSSWPNLLTASHVLSASSDSTKLGITSKRSTEK